MRRGLAGDRDGAELARARDPGVEPLEAAHDLVARPIDLGVARGARSARRRAPAAWQPRPLRPGRGLPCCPFALACFARRACFPVCGEELALGHRLPGRRSLGRPCLQLAIRLDLARIDAGKLRHAPRERGELHRLEEGDQVLVVGLMHGEIGERHVERHLVVERDQLLREPRHLGVVDQGLAAFLLLDLAGAREQRLEVAVFADELRRGLHPDARHARHVVARIPDQRLHLDDLLRRHAEFLDHLGDADPAVLHGVVHDDAVGHELHQVLVRRHDGRGRARLAGLAHIGGDQVVGLEAGLLQAGNVEGAHRLADEARTAGAGRRADRAGAPCSRDTSRCGTSSPTCRRQRRGASAAPPASCRASASTACCRSRARH